jgi:hypothetical protein
LKYFNGPLAKIYQQTVEIEFQQKLETLSVASAFDEKWREKVVTRDCPILCVRDTTRLLGAIDSRARHTSFFLSFWRAPTQRHPDREARDG